MLARIRKAMDSREEGFTLIELLVVIIIIGILAAIAIPVFLNQRQKGYDATAKSDARNAATTEESYLADNNVYYGAATFTTVPAALAAMGMKLSANTTSMAITTYAGAPAVGGTQTSPGTNAGSYCIAALSKSGTTWTFSSGNSGLSTTPCP
jgi:type IV pilus assembly protein PilA